MTTSVRYERQGQVGVITVDNPPVNALSQHVRQGLLDCLAQGLADDEARALVMVGAGRTFIAGADIREFGKPLADPDLNGVIEAYENATKPVVAAIHGTALGGGLEVALGCHYRVAVAAAKVGLPEVKLGILPGAGGTQRLPRVAGVEAAIDMITTGKFVPAGKALKLGIVDAIVDELVPGAVAFAEKLLAENAPLRRVRDMDEKVKAFDPARFEAMRKAVVKAARGQMSPVGCFDSVTASVTLPFEDGLKREREIFTGLIESDQSKALRHIFFAEREALKIPDVPSDTPTLPIRTAAIIGAGTMGGGIAMCFANAGIPVKLLEMTREALDRGLGIIGGNYANTVAKGRLTQEAMDKRMGLIEGVLDYDALSEADIIIEAVFEEMDIKKKVFAALDSVAKAGAILASNTSTLDVDEIAASTSRPEFVIGTHFFSPANVMPLLELVRGAKTSNQVIATSMKLARTIAKVPVLVGNCDGFVGNRMLEPYGQQAELMLLEGAMPAQVDGVMQRWGLAMGPFTMGDMAGLDVGWRIRKRRAATRRNDLFWPTVADQICEMGRFGQKTKAGYYLYEGGSRVPVTDPKIEQLIVEASKAAGIERREISDEEILKRCLYALINEGAKCLEEGMAIRASDVDVIYCFGYGFPAWRGGPMFQADLIGLDKVLADIKRFHAALDDRWKPAKLIETLVAEGRSFADYDRGR
ncbi:3-hydroxyacyl-CoA dehydrogenase NAD-binding domain-containing protein [Tistrella sp. BH-R2-4]|uniref:3-hydroxyacyl-CoA dehydrogenase NAD-binding domain-containing protein n=1 Tax=Tistrella arctica TaxID=3133430 RepID=A0ABU9YS90_9PROT